MKSRLLALLSAILGLGLLVYVIQQTGVDEIWANVRRLGAGFLLVLLISSLRYLARAAAWLRCLPPAARHAKAGIGFWALWRSRLAGEAIGDLTFGPVVAEPLRLMALGDRLSLAAGVQSLAVENIAYTVSSCLLVLAGAVALLAQFGLTGSARDAMVVALVVVTFAIALAVAVVSRRWHLASSIATGLATRFVRFVAPGAGRQAWLAAKIDHLREVESYVFDFYAHRPVDFLSVVACELGFHAAGVLEIYATLRLIGVDLTLATACLLEAVNRAINIAFIFVPALVGVDELLTKLVAETLRLGGTAGVTLAIVRKIRMFCWIGIGLIFLFISRKERER